MTKICRVNRCPLTWIAQTRSDLSPEGRGEAWLGQIEWNGSWSRVGPGEHGLSAISGLGLIGIILDNLSEEAYHLRASSRHPTSFALSTDGSRIKHREAPMFRA